jgi:carbonic anhydrase
MEIQYVHRNATGDVVVVAILGRTSPTKNRVLDPLVQAILQGDAPSAMPRAMAFDPQSLLPAGQTFFRYIGSATTPPCTEGWMWIVFRQPIIVSTAQVVALLNKIGRNARPAGSDYLRGLTEWTPSVYLGD